MTTVHFDKYQTTPSYREVTEEQKPYSNHPGGHCFMVLKLRALNKVHKCFLGIGFLLFQRLYDHRYEGKTCLLPNFILSQFAVVSKFFLIVYEKRK